MIDLDALEKWLTHESVMDMDPAIVDALIAELRAARRQISWMQYAQCGCLGGGGEPPDDWVEIDDGLWEPRR